MTADGGGNKRRERELIWQVIAESLAAVAKETAMLRVEVAATSQSGITFFGYRLKLCWERNGITSNLFRRSAGGARLCTSAHVHTHVNLFFFSVFLHLEGKWN